MTYIETKQLLEQYKRKKYYDERISEIVKDLISRYQTSTFSPLTKVQINKVSKPVEELILKIEQEQEKYIKQSNDFLENNRKLDSALLQLPAEERIIIHDFYIRGKSANYLAANLHYDVKTIYNRIKSGTRLLSKIL